MQTENEDFIEVAHPMAKVYYALGIGAFASAFALPFLLSAGDMIMVIAGSVALTAAQAYLDHRHSSSLNLDNEIFPWGQEEFQDGEIYGLACEPEPAGFE